MPIVQEEPEYETVPPTETTVTEIKTTTPSATTASGLEDALEESNGTDSICQSCNCNCSKENETNSATSTLATSTQSSSTFEPDLKEARRDTINQDIFDEGKKRMFEKSAQFHEFLFFDLQLNITKSGTVWELSSDKKKS